MIDIQQIEFTGGFTTTSRQIVADSLTDNFTENRVQNGTFIDTDRKVAFVEVTHVSNWTAPSGLDKIGTITYNSSTFYVYNTLD